jgi:hypothetical protein
VDVDTISTGGRLADAIGAGRARAKYGVRADGAAYLLRPDQHVCARWVRLDANRLEAALQQALRADAHAASSSSAHVAG